MEAILQASKNPDYPAEIAIVIADSKTAKGLKIASAENLPTAAFERKDYASKSEHEAAVMKAIDSAQADLIILAGYMRILSENFVDTYKGSLINIHPSLLPKYKGLNTHERALKDGESHHGCTVHFVSFEMDSGKIIAQEDLEILPDDTPDTLSTRVLQIEHRLYPATIAAIANGKVKFEEN